MNINKTNSLICSFSGTCGLDLLLANPVATATALFDPGVYNNPTLTRSLLYKFYRSCWGKKGLRLCVDEPEFLTALFAESTNILPDFIVITSFTGNHPALTEQARKYTDTVIREIYNADQAEKAAADGYDALLICGNENGGICGAESNFSLIRKISREQDLPFWVAGGMGPESAAAAGIAGAEKLVLRDTLFLMGKTDRLLPGEKNILINNPQSKASGLPGLVQYRTSLRKAEEPAVQCEKIIHSGQSTEKQLNQWTGALQSISSQSLISSLPPLGEEAFWAAHCASQAESLTELLDQFNNQLTDNLETIGNYYPLRPGNPLAQKRNIEFPVFQGPMAHVSDKPEFLAAVADNGALPFAALALHHGSRLENLLKKTSEILADRPWGAGIIGFAPGNILDQQLELLKKYRPAAVIVAGGRPSHYKQLADMGIPAYLHVPSPGLIRDYFKAGVRYFIFEGRGSGGHVGPINSFSLWQAAVYELTSLAKDNNNDLDGVHVILAGGISDTLSANMAACFAPPLEKLGACFGIIMGTAYLACDESVSSGAIVETFRQTIISCKQTIVLESGDGHAIRCAATPYAKDFIRKKSELHAQGLDKTTIRRTLDKDNIGRLHIASRGLTRQKADQEFTPIPAKQQVREGCYMMGETAGLIDAATTMKTLHQSVCRQPAMKENQQIISNNATRELPESGKYARTDIAVIGMACLVPGAHDPDTFWHNILAKMSLVGPVPESRWRKDINFDADPQTPDKIYSDQGAFLDDVHINSADYGIPPTTVPSIEPAQLLALEAVSMAIADAGYKNKEFDRLNTSVFFGTSGGGGDLALAYSVRSALNEYLGRTTRISDDSREKIMAALADVLPEWTEDSFPGILSNVVAGRISNRFDLKGLNFTVDAACASSLAAVKVACQELVYGDTNLAIVGGVDTTQHPFGYTCFSKTRALSKKGRSRPLHEDSDGIVLGEGVGVTVLKRMEDAVRDNDRIYAVIKGVGGSSDGKGRSMTAPVPEGQVLAVERAYKIAGYSPATVSLIEAHGTGTVLGDRTELTSIRNVLNNAEAKPASCAVGSIKSAIGHTKAAAGINGMIKTCLALHHKILPATLNAEKTDKTTVPDNSPLYINTANRPWFGQTRPRRAGVNSFGFGGTNFHVALEESPIGSVGRQYIPDNLWPGELFCLSGTDDKDLFKSLKVLASLTADNTLSLPLLSRRHYEMQKTAARGVRLALFAADQQELQKHIAFLQDHIRNKRKQHLPSGIWLYQQNQKDLPANLALLFSGQGSQKRNMGREPAMFFPVFRESLENSQSILKNIAETDFLAELFPPPGIAQKPLVATEIVQPTLAITEMGLYRLLVEFGLKPDFCAGHSFGELTALWAAGIINDETMLSLAVQRGRLMAADHENTSGMTAIRIDTAEFAPLIKGIKELYPANYNSPTQTVVSGSIAALDALENRCSTKNISFKRLPVSHGFHSPFMSKAAVKWQKTLQNRMFHKGSIPVFSNQTAQPYPSKPVAIATTLADHLISPVHFVDQIRNMHQAGAKTFVEIGPGRVLTGLTAGILRDTPHQSIALSGSAGQEIKSFIHGIAELWAIGHHVNISPLFRIRHIPDPVAEITPSAAVFKVNGGVALPTVAPQPDETIQPPPQLNFIDENVPAPGNAPLHQPAAQQQSNVGQALNNDKLQLISQFQDSMSLFLDQQEKAQQERREMMQRMWSMQETLFQSLTGTTAPAVHVPTNQPVASPPADRVEPETESSRAVETKQDKTPDKNPVIQPLPDKSGPADLSAMLFEVISKRTGYPKDMLSGSQHLEADLGIDSIKRVEILTALKDCHPALNDIANEKYFEQAAQLRTITEIRDWMADTFMQNKAKEETTDTEQQNSIATEYPAPSPVAKITAPIRRYLLELIEAPFIIGSQWEKNSGLILIIGGNHPLGSAIQKKLTENNKTTILLSQNNNEESFSENSFICDFNDQQNIDGCINNIIKSHGHIAGVINTLPLDCKKEGTGKAAILNTFRLAKSLVSHLQNMNKSFWFSISGMGGDFGLKNVIDYNPLQNGCHGIAKTIGHEVPEIQVKCIDLHPDQIPDKQVRAVFLEMNSGDNLQETCWNGSRRSCIKLRPAPLFVEKEKPFGSNSHKPVFLLTGGGRGITASAAVKLAKLYAPRLILTGRSPLPQRTDIGCAELAQLADMAENDAQGLKAVLIKRIKDRGRIPTPALVNREITNLTNEHNLRCNITRMEEYGADVYYHSVDCTDRVEFSTFIKSIYMDHKHIDGVIHGAGIIRDSLLVNKDEGNFSKVLDTKIIGAEILARELKQQHLAFLVFFSSISGRFGNRGQADYAAANEILNKLAVKLNAAWSTRVTAINWGPWQSDGMVDDTVRKQFDDLGISLIPGRTGVDMLMTEIIASEERAGEVIIFGSRELSTNLAMEMDEKLPLASITPELPVDIRQKSFHFTLNTDSHPYLADHCIDGNPVLPAAMALELMAEAAVLTGENLNFAGLRDFRLFKGIILPAGQSRQIDINVSLISHEENSFRREYMVMLQSSDMPAEQYNYSCTVTLDNKSSLQPVEPDQLQDPVDYPLDVKMMYNTRLFHQGMFRRITAVKGLSINLDGTAGIKGIITPSSPQTTLAASGKWLIDPLLFDCAYQLSLIWSQEFNGMMPLPGDITEYKRFQPYDGNKIFCEVVVKKCDTPILHLDFLFKDKRNRLYAKARDVRVIMNRNLNKRILTGLIRKSGPTPTQTTANRHEQ